MATLIYPCTALRLPTFGGPRLYLSAATAGKSCSCIADRYDYFCAKSRVKLPEHHPEPFVRLTCPSSPRLAPSGLADVFRSINTTCVLACCRDAAMILGMMTAGQYYTPPLMRMHLVVFMIVRFHTALWIT